MLKSCGLASFVLVAVLAAGCGKDEPSGSGSSGSSSSSTPSGPDLSTPQGAMKALQDAFATMDTAKFQAIYRDDIWKEGKMQKELDEMKGAGMKIEIKYNEADIKVDGEKAECQTRMIFTQKDGKVEDEGEKFRMEKIDGKWRFGK